MKTIVVVPVFNCEPVIQHVLAQLVTETSLPILVIDDGSNTPVQNHWSDRVHILRFERNQGKGIALRQALQWCHENGYFHMLSFDGDGQHRVQDVKTLLEKSTEFPQSLVIGRRQFADNVPGISRFGRKFSNFWVWYQTSIKVEDTQSGLRLYPISPLWDLTYFSRRYDFEIEVLVRALWKGMKVQEVDVGVIYPPKDERISHFNKFWDNARITLLNIALIAYSLIFYHRSLAKVFLAGIVAFLSSLLPSLLWSGLFGVVTCVVFRINVLLTLVGFLALYFL